MLLYHDLLLIVLKSRSTDLKFHGHETPHYKSSTTFSDDYDFKCSHNIKYRGERPTAFPEPADRVLAWQGLLAGKFG